MTSRYILVHNNGLDTKCSVWFEFITKYKLHNTARDNYFWENLSRPNGPQSSTLNFIYPYSCMKIVGFVFQLHENIFSMVQLTKGHLWSRQWPGAELMLPSEPMVTLFTATFMHHMSSMSWYLILLDRFCSLWFPIVAGQHLHIESEPRTFIDIK